MYDSIIVHLRDLKKSLISNSDKLPYVVIGWNELDVKIGDISNDRRLSVVYALERLSLRLYSCTDELKSDYNLGNALNRLNNEIVFLSFNILSNDMALTIVYVLNSIIDMLPRNNSFFSKFLFGKSDSVKSKYRKWL